MKIINWFLGLFGYFKETRVAIKFCGELKSLPKADGYVITVPNEIGPDVIVTIRKQWKVMWEDTDRPDLKLMILPNDMELIPLMNLPKCPVNNVLDRNCVHYGVIKSVKGKCLLTGDKCPAGEKQ